MVRGSVLASGIYCNGWTFVRLQLLIVDRWNLWLEIYIYLEDGCILYVQMARSHHQKLL